MSKYPSATCEECNESFPQNRADKQFCSGRCKSRNFRRVQKEKMSLLERLFDRLPNSTPQKQDLFAA